MQTHQHPTSNIQCFFFQTRTWVPNITDKPQTGGESAVLPPAPQKTRNEAQRPAGPSLDQSPPQQCHRLTAPLSLPPHTRRQLLQTCLHSTRWARQRRLKELPYQLCNLAIFSRAYKQAAVEALRECTGKEKLPSNSAVNLHRDIQPC